MKRKEKKFNTTGKCIPARHYMVDIQQRLERMKEMVEDETYFCINRGRQYGKTTTLYMLKSYLEGEYTVFNISFEGMGDEEFANVSSLGRNFFNQMFSRVEYGDCILENKTAEEILEKAAENKDMELTDISKNISKLCNLNNKPIVILIDEVDQAANYDSFIKFLGLLRHKYLDRDVMPTFQSVILASVYNIRNLKLKIRPEAEHSYNSPWNIAVSFEEAMELSADGIAGMLSEYENDHHTGMDVNFIAQEIYKYTNGYPFLVSRLCQLMDDEQNESDWTSAGLQKAIKILVEEKNTLFGSMMSKIENYPSIKEKLYSLLFGGEKIAYNTDSAIIDIMDMFGFVKKSNSSMIITNKIFEMRLYNYFLTESKAQEHPLFRKGYEDTSQFITNGKLNMDIVMEKFIEYFDEIYGDTKTGFSEEEGRRYFLLFLKPIINGTGNYYVEAQTRNSRRMDVVVDFAGERFVIELKIWRGNAYNERGEQQLIDYLDYFRLQKGYLLSYNFNKSKKIGVHTINIGDKEIVEAVV